MVKGTKLILDRHMSPLISVQCIINLCYFSSAVSNVATDVDMGLKEIYQLLEEEAKNEEEFQVILYSVSVKSYHYLNFNILENI